MSLKKGFILGCGALAGGALGFWIQDRLLSDIKRDTATHIDLEVERRVQEELRNRGEIRSSSLADSRGPTSLNRQRDIGFKVESG